jgi:hypothetical protein
MSGLPSCYGCKVFHDVNAPQFLYPFMDIDGQFGEFHILAIVTC